MVKRQVLIVISVSLIFMLGLIMIFSTTSAEVLDHNLEKSTHQAFMRQIYYAIAGLGLAYIIWKKGYKSLLENSFPWLCLLTVLLVLVLIPGVGREVNGSKRWIGIAGFSFQPSEFVKYILPAYFIYRYLQFNPETFDLKDFLRLVGTVAVPILLILVEPNNGTAAVIGMTVTMLCLVAQIPLRFWALPLAVLVLLGGVSAYHLPYVTARLKVYLNPELDLKGKGHQPYQAKIAAGSGGLIGKGPGNSLQKLSYLPEAQNDYIAAIYAEEFGYVGMLMLISLYMLVAYLGFSIASQAPNQAACYMASSVTFLITFQAFLNLGVVSGLLPSTGLNLPFFSQGGTSLIANIAGIGLLLNIAQQKEALFTKSQPT